MPSGKVRDKILLRLFGGPDPVRADGLGGTDSHTSKLMVISESQVPGVDIEYTFGQVALDQALIDYKGNCGNLTSAIGPFAVDHGLVKSTEPYTILNLLNTNTKKRVMARFEVEGGITKYEGNYSIDGVAGRGSRIDTTFFDPGGSLTGSLLPTGNVVDKIATTHGVYECSVVDVTNPVVFVRASDMGLTGRELPEQVNSDRSILEKFEAIRAVAAEMIGLVKSREEATRKSPLIPFVAMVSKKCDYTASSDIKVRAQDISLVARIFSLQKMHYTFAVTGAMCTGAAAKIDGTVVNEVLDKESQTVVIGHAKGILDVKVDSKRTSSGVQIKGITIGRTARKLMEGRAFYSDANL